MLSRALSLATVMLLTGFATVPVQAQNLEAGKSPSQVFAGGCAVCHKSPRGLLKTVAPGSLSGFLRQHYTTSADMASAMSAYVISNGAADRRAPGDNLTKQGRELSTEHKPGAEPTPSSGRQRRETAKPDADGPSDIERGTRRGRNAKRHAIPAEENSEAGKPEATKPAVEASPGTATEVAHPASQKQKLGKKGRRHQEEPPKAEPVRDEPKAAEPKAVEPKAAEPTSEPVKPETPKQEVSKPAPVKPAEENKQEVDKPEPKAEKSPATRTDPVPAVTPAPTETAPASAPSPAPVVPAPAAPAPVVPPPAAAAPTPAPEPVRPSVPPPVPPSAVPPPASSAPSAPPAAPVSQ